jgi:hypothetical protein
MKKLLLILLLTIPGFLQAQHGQKNSFYVGYSNLTADHSAGGNIKAEGYELGYTRFLKDRFYGDIYFGKSNFQGRNSIFYLDPSEMDYFNMTNFSLGFGYNLVEKRRFVISSGLSYYRQTTHELIHLLESGGISIRETGRIVDQTARVNLKAHFYIIDNLQFIPSIAYGIQLQRYESIALKAGLAYSF